MSKMIQQHLWLTTSRESFRSSVEGWGAEDPTLFVPGKPIGMTPGPRWRYLYDTPFAAAADGWHLLAPPEEHSSHSDETSTVSWTWWFVRSVETQS